MGLLLNWRKMLVGSQYWAQWPLTTIWSLSRFWVFRTAAIFSWYFKNFHQLELRRELCERWSSFDLGIEPGVIMKPRFLRWSQKEKNRCNVKSWFVIISMERVVDLWNHLMRFSESYLSFFFWPTFITGILLCQLVLFRIALGLNVAMLHATISIEYSCAYICRTPEITFKCLIPKSPVLRFFTRTINRQFYPYFTSGLARTKFFIRTGIMYLCTKTVLLRRSVACLQGLGYLSASRNVISDNLEAGVMSKEFFSGMFSDDDSKAGDGFHPRRIRSPQVYPRADSRYVSSGSCATTSISKKTTWSCDLFTWCHVLSLPLWLLRFSALFSCSYSRYVHVVSRSLFSPPLAPSVQCAVLLLLFPLRSHGITFSLFPSSGSFGSVRCFRAPIAWHVRVCTCLR